MFYLSVPSLGGLGVINGAVLPELGGVEQPGWGRRPLPAPRGEAVLWQRSAITGTG